MGYSSFLTLMRSEDTKFTQKNMVKALKESHGVLILDEGQIPRNTKSILRKCFMKLPIELRILFYCTFSE
jgi:hypothetical protein